MQANKPQLQTAESNEGLEQWETNSLSSHSRIP